MLIVFCIIIFISIYRITLRIYSIFIYICNMQQYPVVLFDGVCNYCNSMVNFSIRCDKQKKLRYTPLQSATGIALHKQHQIPPSVDSLVLIENNKAYTYSTAALRICRHYSFPGKLLSVLLIIPVFIRDPVYKWIAGNRYKWFGKKDQCMIPSPGVKELFLD